MFALLLAQTQTPNPAAPGGGLGMMVPLLLMLVVFYFIMIRPQARRQKEQQRLVGSLKTGDHVVTNGGIHGIVANVKETTVLVRVAENVKIEMDKTAVTSVKSSEPAAK